MSSRALAPTRFRLSRRPRNCGPGG